MDKKAFVFTGMAFLLVFPAAILTASYLNMARTGETSRQIMMEADRVFYIKKDFEETIITAAQNSGRYSAFLATQNITTIFENLTNAQGLDYAVNHSWFTDSELTTSNSCDVIEEATMNAINDALASLVGNYTLTLTYNNGDNITASVIDISMTDPWGFYVNVSPLPLFIQDQTASFSVTIPSIYTYVSIEGLQDPYYFVNTKGRASNRITQTPYTPVSTRYDENVSYTDYNLTQLGNVFIGAGTANDPKPYYHSHNASGSTGGLSFFERLNGGASASCSTDAARMETFIIGDPLTDRTTVSRIDHYYFNNINASTVTICGSSMSDSGGNTFYIDDTHLSLLGLSRDYGCAAGIDLTISSSDITFSSSTLIVGDSVTISATVDNGGTLDASSVVVQFWDGDPDAGGTQIGADQTIGSITAGGTGSANVAWTADGGTSTIYVRVDPSNTISETDENNNEATNSICAGSQLSPSIVTPSDSFSTDICVGTTVSVNATVQDECGTYYNGSDITATASFDNGDANVSLLDADSDGNYTGTWSPGNTGSPAVVNVTATHASLAQGEANISGTVTSCGTTAIGETGLLQTDETWVSVTFQNTYSTAPVVIVSPITYVGSGAGVARIRNLATTGFDVRYEEYPSMDGSHSTETFGWIAIMSGSYTIDGNMVEVGTASVTNSFTTVTFNNSFSATPAILTHIQSYNEADAGSHTRQRNPATGSFDVKIEEETDTSHASETVGYIAMVDDTYDTSGGWMEAGVTPDAVKQNWYTVSFTSSFSSSPVVTAMIMSHDGGDNSAERMRNVGTGSFQLRVQETSAYNDVHTKETCGWIAADDNMIIYPD